MMYEEPLSLLPFLQQEDIASIDGFLQAALRRIVATVRPVVRAAIYHEQDGEAALWALAQAPDAPGEPPAPASYRHSLQGLTPIVDAERTQILVPLRENQHQHGLLVLSYTGDAPALALAVDLAGQITFGIRHMEMRQAREHATTIMRSFNDWILRSSQERDERVVLTQAVHILKEATRCDNVAIALLVDRQIEPYFEVEAATPQEFIGERLVDPERAVINLLRESEPPLVLNTAADHHRLPQNLAEHLAALKASVVVIVPMFDAENTLLGITVLTYKKAFINDETLSTAQTVVAQLTINIQKTRLLREMQNQAAQMQRLTTFSEAMQASLHTPELLAILLERLPYLLPVEYCAVLLYDREGEALCLSALSQQGTNSVAVPGPALEPESNTIAEHVWKTQEAIWINALQDTWTWQHPFISHLQTILAAPLSSNGIRIGVLEIGSVQANQYSQTDMVAFEQVSNQLAAGLANAEAYAQSQQLARNKILANDIVAQLQRQMEVEDILRITASELGHALGARRARIRLGYDTRKKGEGDA